MRDKISDEEREFLIVSLLADRLRADQDVPWYKAASTDTVSLSVLLRALESRARELYAATCRAPR